MGFANRLLSESRPSSMPWTIPLNGAGAGQANDLARAAALLEKHRPGRLAPYRAL
jgi:hypothetical protein